jgi:hypothetical protein
MINKQYSITQASNYWADIIKRIEQGYSIKLTRNLAQTKVWTPKNISIDFQVNNFQKPDRFPKPVRFGV